MTDREKFARLGDVIECDVRHPVPSTLREKLVTRESVAYANELLADKTSGWRLSAASSRAGDGTP